MVADERRSSQEHERVSDLRRGSEGSKRSGAQVSEMVRQSDNGDTVNVVATNNNADKLEPISQ